MIKEIRCRRGDPVFQWIRICFNICLPNRLPVSCWM